MNQKRPNLVPALLASAFLFATPAALAATITVNPGNALLDYEWAADVSGMVGYDLANGSPLETFEESAEGQGQTDYQQLQAGGDADLSSGLIEGPAGGAPWANASAGITTNLQGSGSETLSVGLSTYANAFAGFEAGEVSSALPSGFAFAMATIPFVITPDSDEGSGFSLEISYRVEVDQQDFDPAGLPPFLMGEWGFNLIGQTGQSIYADDHFLEGDDQVEFDSANNLTFFQRTHLIESLSYAPTFDSASFALEVLSSTWAFAESSTDIELIIGNSGEFLFNILDQTSQQRSSFTNFQVSIRVIPTEGRDVPAPPAWALLLFGLVCLRSYRKSIPSSVP